MGGLLRHHPRRLRRRAAQDGRGLLDVLTCSRSGTRYLLGPPVANFAMRGAQPDATGAWSFLMVFRMAAQIFTQPLELFRSGCLERIGSLLFFRTGRQLMNIVR